MFCGNCGKEIDDDAAFCGYCGKQTSGTSKEASSQSPVEATAKITPLESAERGPEPPPSMHAGSEASQNEFKSAEASTGNKNKNIIIIVLLCVLAIALIGGGVAFGMAAKSLERQSESSSKLSTDEDTFSRDRQEDEAGTKDSSDAATKEETPNLDRIIDSFIELENENYILPYSNSRLITRSDIASFSDFELYVARNEIYARLGRGFQNQDLQDYFNRKSWYVQRYSPEEFDAKVTVSDIERENALTIRKEEERRGSKYL